MPHLPLVCPARPFARAQAVAVAPATRGKPRRGKGRLGSQSLRAFGGTFLPALLPVPALTFCHVLDVIKNDEPLGYEVILNVAS